MRCLLALRRFSWGQRIEVGRIVLVCIAVEAGIRRIPLPRLTSLLGLELAPGRVELAEPDGVPVWAVDRLCLVEGVLKRWPWGSTCLRRTLVGGHRIRRLHPVVHIGVRGSATRPNVHAWLAVAGVPLDQDAPEFGDLRWS